MALEKLLETDEFLIIAELEPPKGVATTDFENNADTLRDVVGHQSGDADAQVNVVSVLEFTRRS